LQSLKPENPVAAINDGIQFARIFYASRNPPAFRRVALAWFLMPLYITFHGNDAMPTRQRDNIMKTSKFLGMLSLTERALTGAASVTMSLAITTVIATAFQGAAIADSPALFAMLTKAFA